MLRLPNLITLLRVIAAPFVVWLLYNGRYREALLVLLAAGITDWLDGFTARKLGMTNHLGVVLDPLADKALMVAVFVTLGLLQLIPWWLFAMVIVRDLVIVTGALLLRVIKNRREFLPSMLGKVSTFFQIVLSLLAVLFAAYPRPIIEWLKFAGIALTAIFTLLSGLEYIRRGIEIARSPALASNEAQ